MSDKRPIITGIIATVGGGLILAGVLSVIDKLPAIVGVIVGAIADSVLYAFGLLGTPIPLWVSLLGLVLFVPAISTQRRLARWIRKRASQKLPEPVPTVDELFNDMKKQVLDPKLDKVLIESVVDEEYDDEEEEEEWRSYTSDNILGIDWQWRWEGTTIESLTPICPNCKLELSEKTRPFSSTGYDNRAYLEGITCQDEACDFRYYPNVRTVPEYHEIIKKHIRRNAHEMGLPA